MPGIFEDAAAAAKRAAEEAAERAREMRRNYLRGQIRDWGNKLSEVTPLRDVLVKEKNNLDDYMRNWEVQKDKCEGNLFLSEIVLTNRFEGECADRIKKDFTASIEEMNNTCLKTRILQKGNDQQITRLNQYISLINEKISSLTRELNSI